MFKKVGPRGININVKGLLFLATEAATKLWFGMVIGNDYPHTHSGKYGQYVEVCAPQGQIMKYKVPAFPEQLRQPLRSGLVQ